MNSDQKSSSLEGQQNEKKLVPEERLEMVRYLAQFHSIPETIAFVRDKFGKELAYMTVKGYLESPKWRSTILHFRDEFTRAFMDVAIANKRVRMERLEEICQRAYQAKKFSVALKALQAAHKEVEAVEADPDQWSRIHSEFANMTDEQLKEQRRETLKQIVEIMPREEFEKVREEYDRIKASNERGAP